MRLAIKEMEVGGSLIPEVSKADVLRLLDMHRTKKSLAYVRFHALDRFFNWFAERDEKFANPCQLIGKRFRPKRPAVRKRVYGAIRCKPFGPMQTSLTRHGAIFCGFWCSLPYVGRKPAT